MKFKDVDKILAALRSKTVANGATPGEAASAQAKADEIERKYKPKPQDTLSDRDRRRQARMDAEDREWARDRAERRKKK